MNDLLEADPDRLRMKLALNAARNAADEGETPVGTGETDLQDAVAQAAEELATEPEAQGEGPGWVLVDGTAVYADIYELLRLARENSATITLCTTDVIAVSEYSAESAAYPPSATRPTTPAPTARATSPTPPTHARATPSRGSIRMSG